MKKFTNDEIRECLYYLKAQHGYIWRKTEKMHIQKVTEIFNDLVEENLLLNSYIEKIKKFGLVVDGPKQIKNPELLHEQLKEIEEKLTNMQKRETWYLLFDGISVDGRGDPKFIGRTTNKNSAYSHYKKCEVDPYCTGKVVIVTDNSYNLADREIDWNSL